jgi:hypothetical protein
MSVERKSIPSNQLMLVTPVEAFHDPREPALAIGARVRVNSGGPPMLVVEIDGADVTVAYRNDAGRAREYTIPAVCVHRIREERAAESRTIK